MSDLYLPHVVVIHDRGMDEPRTLPRLYPDHASAICVKHNLQATGRFNTVYARLATDAEIAEKLDYDPND